MKFTPKKNFNSFGSNGSTVRKAPGGYYAPGMGTYNPKQSKQVNITGSGENNNTQTTTAQQNQQDYY